MSVVAKIGSVVSVEWRKKSILEINFDTLHSHSTTCVHHSWSSRDQPGRVRGVEREGGGFGVG